MIIVTDFKKIILDINNYYRMLYISKNLIQYKNQIITTYILQSDMIANNKNWTKIIITNTIKLCNQSTELI